MKEPHKKGLANHLDPESCAGGRKAAGEALTGAHTGQPLSSEITFIGVPTLCCEGEGQMRDDDNCEPSGNAAESQTLSMCGNSMRENRETSGTPAPLGRGPVGEGRWPHVRYARPRGVGRSHSTDEAGEQSWPAGSGGVRGGKGIEQGDGPSR